jgi:hypothetical protein
MKVIKVESRATLNILKEMGEIIKQENTIGTFNLTSPMGEKCLTLMASGDIKLAEVSVTFDGIVKIVLFDEKLVDEIKSEPEYNVMKTLAPLFYLDRSIKICEETFNEISENTIIEYDSKQNKLELFPNNIYSDLLSIFSQEKEFNRYKKFDKVKIVRDNSELVIVASASNNGMTPIKFTYYSKDINIKYIKEKSTDKKEIKDKHRKKYARHNTISEIFNIEVKDLLGASNIAYQINSRKSHWNYDKYYEKELLQKIYDEIFEVVTEHINFENKDTVDYLMCNNLGLLEKPQLAVDKICKIANDLSDITDDNYCQLNMEMLDGEYIQPVKITKESIDIMCNYKLSMDEAVQMIKRYWEIFREKKAITMEIMPNDYNGIDVSIIKKAGKILINKEKISKSDIEKFKALSKGHNLKVELFAERTFKTTIIINGEVIK